MQINKHFFFQLKTFVTLQDTPKTKRESTGSEKRSAKKQRTDSNASSNNRFGSISPAMNHSTPMRKSGSLLDRPANISTPVSVFLFDYRYHCFYLWVGSFFIV